MIKIFAGVTVSILLFSLGIVEGYTSYKNHVKMNTIKEGVCLLDTSLPSWEKEKLENYSRVVRKENRHVLIAFIVPDEEGNPELAEATIDISELLNHEVVACPLELEVK